MERLHDVSADSLRKSAGKAKGTGAPLVFSLSRGPNKPPFKVQELAIAVVHSCVTEDTSNSNQNSSGASDCNSSSAGCCCGHPM